jgi:hypothetical protein
MVTAPGVDTPAPIEPPILKEVNTSESNNSVSMSLGAAPAFGEMFAKTGSSGRSVLAVFCALLLLAGGVAGLLWYVQAAPDRSATTSPSTSPAVAGSLPSSNKPWELIPNQTTGVADAANALGVADQHMAVINPGGQLALAYREGKFFGDGHGADLRVYGPERGRVSYLIYVRNDPDENWERIDIYHNGFSRGVAMHDMGHHGVRQARQVMIRNNGNADLRIDAVSVVYRDEVHGESAKRRRH